jgi:hypothetical protein
MLRKTFSLLTVSYMISVGADRCVPASQETVPHVIKEIVPSALVDGGNTAQVRAFDVAPDGSAVAVLYASWGSSPHPIGPELSIAMWDISSNKFAWKQRIATDTLSGAAQVHDVKEVIFTADQNHLLALGMNTVWSIDARSGAVLSSISPSDNESGAPVQMKALGGAAVAITYSQNETGSFYTRLIDAASGKQITGWLTSVIPQSFSQDGKLAITINPGQYDAGRVADLEVIDTTTGAKLRAIPVGVGFEKRHSHDSMSAMARFLSSTQVVVAPDHMIDHPGKHAEYGLELIDVSDGRLVREIFPQYFRPTGELVVSENGNKFVAYSVYASPRDFRLDSPRPKKLKVNLFIFSRDGTQEATIPNLYIGLAGGRGEPLRLSSDGSVLAVSERQSGAIKVFQLGPGGWHRR